jgi:exodeoxyribonuclease V beta subunit
VIVLDKLTRPNSDKAPLLFHYNEALYIDQILYRTANRESFDTHYARVLEERKASAEKDRMNVLYVALTRAVEGLIVVKKPEGSIFDAIHMVPVERGVLQVLPKAEEETLSKTKETENMTLSYYGSQEVKERQEEDEKDLDAILFGTALHYALEMMGRFEESQIASALTAVRNRYGQLLSPEALQQKENRIRRLVNDAAFQVLLENAEISREQAFFFDGEMRQIDLLLTYDDHMLVIDYKSSRKYHIEHQEQVQTYRRAVERITGKPTEGMLVYLLKDEISIENLK